MNTSSQTYARTDDVSEHWVLLMTLGIALIVFGVLACYSAFVATLLSVAFLGWLLLFGGIAQSIHAFAARKQGHFLLNLGMAILTLIVGVLMLANPAAGAVTLTLLLALFFMAGGMFRLVTAIATRPPSWGWMALNGTITFILGLLVLAQWPVSGLWVIGLFVGIDLIFSGWTLAVLSIGVKKLAERARPRAQTPQAA